jgi:hypothetical protein
MDSSKLREAAERYIEMQLKTLEENGSSPAVTPETREEMVVSAMRVAGYDDGTGAGFR